jgi:hypothetical protein
MIEMDNEKSIAKRRTPWEIAENWYEQIGSVN